MKKIFTFFLTAVMAVALVSCKGGVEKKAEEFAEKIKVAAEAEDMAKVSELCTEFNNWFEGLKADEKASLGQYKGYVDMISELSDFSIDLDNTSFDGIFDDAAENVSAKLNGYMEQMYQAYMDGNEELAESISDQIDAWAENLTPDQEEEATKALEEFFKAHPELLDEID